MSGGLNIAWSVGFRGPISYSVSKHNFIAWFIAAIIGALISCGLANRVAKKYVLLFASVLVAIGGLIIACTHNNGAGTVAACYLDGIANGLVFAPFMALVGEVSVPYKRGVYSASLEQMCYGVGIMLQILYVSSWTYSYSYSHNSFTAQNMKGVLSTIYGFLALIFGYLMIIESPVQMLANNDEQGAIDALRRLQKPAVLSEETYDLLAEHKRYLAGSKDLSLGQSISQGLLTFVRLAYLRALNAMSISKFVYFTLVISILSGFSVEEAQAGYVAFAVFRFIGTVVPTLSMDCLGRKKPTVFGLVLCCALSFALGAKYNVFDNIGGLIVLLLLIFEFFAGMASAATSSYISEAYPLGVKQHFIAFTFITEMLVFLIINVCDFYLLQGDNYFYVMGAMYLVGFILAVISLPETSRMTLRGAQEQFSKFLNVRF